jgi:AraC family transcriptional regulator
VNASSIKRYQVRLQRVLEHIEAHLGDELTVEALSDVAAFSKHHFHRQFTSLFGIGVYRYVQLARLKRASYRLAFRDDDSILEIALDSGYEGPEAFARAFKQQIGQTPSGFREQPQWKPWYALYRPISDMKAIHMKRDWQLDRVKLVDTKDLRVLVLEHRGDPALLGDSIRRFIAWRKTVGLPPRLGPTFNILYDDPTTTPPDAFRLDLCVASDRALGADDTGLVAKMIPGGRCAVLRHVGSDDTFNDAAEFLYGTWLPQSGEEMRDVPFYCQRVAFFPDVPEHEAVTDLFLPLK